MILSAFKGRLGRMPEHRDQTILPNCPKQPGRVHGST